MSGKYSKKLLDHAKQSATDAFKTASKGAIQKRAETTGDLISNKIANTVAKSYDGKITGVLKHPQQNNSETITNEHDKEIPKERYISRTKTRNYWWTKIKTVIEYQKIKKVSTNSQQYNLETVTNDNDKEIPKEGCISPEERQKVYLQKKDRKLLII